MLEPIEYILPEHAAHDAEQSKAESEDANEQATIAPLSPHGAALRGHVWRRFTALRRSKSQKLFVCYY